jgi:hypothetical protein
MADLEASGALGALACCPPSVPMPPAPERRRKYPVPTIEVRPGLVIREMTEAESEQFAEHLVRAKLYEEPDEFTHVRVTEWFHDALCWPMAVVWRGEPIAFESYHFLDSRPGVIQVGFNVRIRRDRPYRFWGTAFKPYFEHLKSIGIETIESRVRGDRPEYIDGLIRTYGAIRVSGDDEWVNLRYRIDRAIATAAPWPTMRTAGPGWEWSQENVRVWEGSQPEIDALPALLDAAWGRVPGGGRAKRILEDWPSLDAATVLLGSVSGAVRYASVFRYRSGGVAAWASLLPFGDEPSQNVAVSGMVAWARAVGYVRGVMFIPKAQFDAPVMQAHIASHGDRVIRVHPDGDQVHEVEYDF